MRELIGSLLAAPAGAAPRPRAGFNDIILAFGAVLIIGVMILPLPIVALDALVAINIAIGFGLLTWGTWRNGAFRRLDEPTPLHAGGRNATIIGTLFVLVSFFVRYALGR